MRILVVDDERDVRALMVTVLEDAGHDLAELYSGS
jgi:CheY-like chemotaxis protein